MTDSETLAVSVHDELPVASTLGPAVAARAPRRLALVDRRVAVISGLAIAVAFGASLMARGLIGLIGLFTNLAFYGRLSGEFVSPAGNSLGPFVIVVPVAGGLIVGLMARYWSEGIRGDGIPEAMERVLMNQSLVPLRLTFLKPLSAAIAIGTGGPFGAEGPIIATGGALGSMVGQMFETTAAERKTLLAAGAAAGLTASFGSPVSAVLLAAELLLFEFRPRSLIPVALASATAAAVRGAIVGSAPMFAMRNLTAPSGAALTCYIALGAIVGVASVYVTRAVYAIEDGFARLPVHWMWWPAVGGLAVGLIGLVAPRTLGVGYDNIADIVAGNFPVKALVVLSGLKFMSWAVALGSGTSGGTLAPLFMIGGGLGGTVGAFIGAVLPATNIDVRIASLVGMAAIFAGSWRVLLSAVVFAFETTLQPLGLLPLLGGCTSAYFVSCLMMRNTIMTEKIARRGVRVPDGYVADFLEQILVRECASPRVISLRGGQRLAEVRIWIASGTEGTQHQGFPVLDAEGLLLGVVTRRELLDPSREEDVALENIIGRPPVVAYDGSTLREAADLMVEENIGRLPVVARSAPRMIVGILDSKRPAIGPQTALGRGGPLPPGPEVQQGVSSPWRPRSGWARHPIPAAHVCLSDCFGNLVSCLVSAVLFIPLLSAER